MPGPTDARAEAEIAPELGAQLWALEAALLRGETRADRARMDALLHPAMVEVGRDGRVWSRAELLDEIVAPADAPQVVADQVRVVALGAASALVTYRSTHVGPDGDRHRVTWRTSIWVATEGGWRLRHHQGTPADDLGAAHDVEAAISG